MSKYELDIIVNNRPVKKYNHDYRVYVEGRKNSPYTLRFRNNTGSRVLAILSVDGLSIMDGKAASDKSSGYVVNAWSTIEVPGWRINSDKVAQFKFRPQEAGYDRTYAEELRSEGIAVDTGNQGVIGVMVYEEKVVPKFVYRPTGPYTWDRYEYTSNNNDALKYRSTYSSTLRSMDLTGSGNITASASSLNNGYNTVSGYTPDWQEFKAEEKSLGTGWGDEQKFETTSVNFERATTYPEYVGTIIYDTLIGLRKRGVHVDDETDTNPVASAFPGWSGNGCYVPKNRR